MDGDGSLVRKRKEREMSMSREEDEEKAQVAQVRRRARSATKLSVKGAWFRFTILVECDDSPGPSLNCKARQQRRRGANRPPSCACPFLIPFTAASACGSHRRAHEQGTRYPALHASDDAYHGNSHARTVIKSYVLDRILYAI